MASVSRFSVGLRPKVADDQLEGIEQALLEGALAHGSATDVWTLERIAVVIQGLTGVGLSNPSVWRLLRNRLGWTVQRPQRQAKERDEEAIQRWVQQEWPRIKKGPRKIGLARLPRRVGHLADPTGAAHLGPAWPHADPAPPHGLEARQHGGGAGLPARRDQGAVVLHLQPDSYDTDSLIGVLEQRNGFYAGHQVVLLWGGLSAHWSHKMRTHLAAQRAWLSVERLPAYAPDLNPVEYLWANLKGTELANFTGDTIAEVADQPHHSIQRVCDSDSLIVGFLAHTSLSLDNDPSP